jgi:hypothetical protein
VAALAEGHGERFPEPNRHKLASATRWLLGLLDAPSGKTPNLGPNDGANLLPLSTASFEDYRPTLQAAGRAFVGCSFFPASLGDELSLWLGLEASPPAAVPPPLHPTRLTHPEGSSWAYLRAARFTSRPGHADQLHLDLWWRGLNLTLDAGSYLYNAPPPWDNALARTAVHNTLMVNGQEQMTPAGRFLWLDWAQARVLERQEAGGRLAALTAQHNGYRRLGVFHQRAVQAQVPNEWLITDSVRRVNGKRQSAKGKIPVTVRLHWLLPDLPWELEGVALKLATPWGAVRLVVMVADGQPWQAQLARAGETLRGETPASPEQGWVAPTYGSKQPALSFAVTVQGTLPVILTSRWVLGA